MKQKFHCKNGAVFEIYRNVLRNKWRPDTTMFTLLLHSINDEYSYMQPVIMANILKFGFETASISSILIDVLSECGEFEDARSMFDISVKDINNYNSMIHGYALHCNPKWFELFEAMKQQGVQPESFTYLAALKACHVFGDIKRCKMIMEEMDRSSIVVENKHRACAIGMFIQLGFLEEVFCHLMKLPSNDWNDVWIDLLHRCILLRSIKIGLEVVEVVLSNNLNSTSCHTQALDFYGLCEMWNKVAEIDDLMEKKMMMKPGFSQFDEDNEVSYDSL